MSRKDEKWERAEEARAESRRFTMAEDEQIVPKSAAQQEEEHRALMTGENAPEWARVVANPEMLPSAPLDETEVTKRLAALEVEHANAVKALEDVLAEQRRVLNEQIIARKAAEDAQAATAELPAKLADTLAQIRAFAPVVSNPVDRGREALARALRNVDRRERRAKGELNVEPDEQEPVYADQQAAPTISSMQDEQRARVAAPLAAAAAFQEQIKQWEAAVGESFDTLYVADGDSDRSVVDDLMRGVPVTQRNVALVTALINTVRSTVYLKRILVQTLEEQVREVNTLVATVHTYGPFIDRGDKSHGYYTFERAMGYALNRLATVTPESVAELWNSAKVVTDRLTLIAEIRAVNADHPVAPVTWENKGDIAESALEAARRSAAPGGVGRAVKAIMEWSPFDSTEGRK